LEAGANHFVEFNTLNFSHTQIVIWNNIRLQHLSVYASNNTQLAINISFISRSNNNEE